LEEKTTTMELATSLPTCCSDKMAKKMLPILGATQQAIIKYIPKGRKDAKGTKVPFS